MLEGVEKVIIREYEERVVIQKKIFDKYNMNNIAYFDIETMGFDKENDETVLISLGWYNNEFKFTIKQYYAEQLGDEKNLLKAFGDDIKKFNVWCSYNGIAFDEPFIKRRMEINELKYKFPIKHIDLYRIIRPYYKNFGIKRCNLKTIEKLVGVTRKDEIDGGMSVELYEKYLANKEEKIQEIIMLHNYEDVLNLPKIFNLVYEIENNKEMVRDNAITEKQMKYLKFLLNKSHLKIDKDLSKISKKSASRVITSILNGEKDTDKLECIIRNSY